jgi:hypothetical protein
MHVLILADRSMALRERAMLMRLEVGLADEGVRVVHGVPRAPGDAQPQGLYSTAVAYDDSALAVGRTRRVRRFLHAVERAEQDAVGGEPGFDIVHAFGVGCWPFALEIARQTGAGVLLELWRSSAIAQAAVLASRQHPTDMRFAVSESPIAAELRKRAGAAVVVRAPWGVHASSAPRPAFAGTRPLAAALLADAGDARATRAALAGLAEATSAAGVEFLLFLGTEDGAPAREAAVWSAARKLGILDRLSMVPEMEARREPVLQMDMLLLPEPTGRERTLALEAMGSGMIVVAVADPFIESLADGVTARLIAQQTPEAWRAGLTGLLSDRAAAADLGRSAHAWVRDHRAASSQVADVLRAYAQFEPRRAAVGSGASS